MSRHLACFGWLVQGLEKAWKWTQFLQCGHRLSLPANPSGVCQDFTFSQGTAALVLSNLWHSGDMYFVAVYAPWGLQPILIPGVHESF